MKAVVIFNLGGPLNLKDIRPFLFNLFYDRSILDLPNPMRFILAKIISIFRSRKANTIYENIGGGSPILRKTNQQASELQNLLGRNYKVFTCMRYWHPMINEVIEDIKKGRYEEIVLLPLYPQFSLSTTDSFFKEWERQYLTSHIKIPVKKICCYPQEEGFVKAQVNLLKQNVIDKSIGRNSRFIFSAHGLPLKNIKNGDPYEKHVRLSVDSIVSQFSKDIDYSICYQSKVGPLEWLGPSIEDELIRCQKDSKEAVIIPISFVSENSETLYELDIQYKDFAREIGLKGYYRMPTLDDSADYINLLADLVIGGGEKKCDKIQCGKKYCESYFKRVKHA